MTNVAKMHEDPACNTKARQGKTDQSAYNWLFTWNGYSKNDIDKVLKIGNQKTCTYYVFQEETGEGGNKHLQGVLCFSSHRIMKNLMKAMPGAHLEVAESVGACKNYCSKARTRTGERWCSEQDPINDPMDGLTLRDWQRPILNLVETEPGPRTINWYWEATGNVGKTTLAKHLCIVNRDCIYVTGTSADIKYAIANSKRKPKVVIWDLPRSSLNHLSYRALEEIKNGIFFSTKFESGMCLFNPPHVIVFANAPPIVENLSGDRWNVVNLK